MTDNKYANGKIYKITDIGYHKCYIGSTVQPLCKRMASHRTKFKLFLSGKMHFTTSFGLFEEYGVENCKIELIEVAPCGSNEQLLQREGYFIRQLDCVNKQVPDRTKKECNRDYYLKNKEEINKQKKQYYETNKEILLNKRLEWYNQNKEAIDCPNCCSPITRHSLARHQRSKKCQEHKP